jgi:hypothetical protein
LNIGPCRVLSYLRARAIEIVLQQGERPSFPEI